MWVYFSLEKLNKHKCWLSPNLLSANNLNITYSTQWKFSLFISLKLIALFLFTVAIRGLQLKEKKFILIKKKKEHSHIHVNIFPWYRSYKNGEGERGLPLCKFLLNGWNNSMKYGFPVLAASAFIPLIFYWMKLSSTMPASLTVSVKQYPAGHNIKFCWGHWYLKVFNISLRLWSKIYWDNWCIPLSRVRFTSQPPGQALFPPGIL